MCQPTKNKQNNAMNTEIINEITANVPSTFEKFMYAGGESGQFGKYLTDWDVYFHVNGIHIRAAIVKGSSRCYVKGVEYWDLRVNSVYVNGKRLNDGRFDWNPDRENREAIEKLEQKILEIAKLQPVYEENLKLFNAC